MVEAQLGLGYDDLLKLARTADSAGFQTFYRSDHYASDVDTPGPQRSTTDAWTSLAGLARDTTRIRIGTLVTPATFRPPGVLGKMVTTVDHMSGGRVDLGLGAGWNADEHRRHGLGFPDARTRMELLAETLAILELLWGEDGGSYRGRHWQLHDTHFQPKPMQQPRPRIILGGHAGPWSSALAARYADEYNVFETSPAVASDRIERVKRACRDDGRETASLVGSVLIGVLSGRTRSRLEERAAVIGPEVGESTEVEAFRANRGATWLIGSPDEVRRQIQQYEAVGIEKLIFQDFAPFDLELVEELAEIAATSYVH